MEQEYREYASGLGLESEEENQVNEELNDADRFPATLEDFLAENTVINQTASVSISERLKDFKFKIGSMTKEEHEKYQKLCIVRAKNGKVVDQKQHLFNELVVINHCLYPDFKKMEFLGKLNVSTPSQALHKTLKIGEISALAIEILKFNGFDDDFDATRATAKN